MFGNLPPISDPQQAIADLEMMFTSATTVTIEMGWDQAWALLCAAQLASRHPGYPTSAVLHIATTSARQIQEKIAVTPALAELAQAGWDQTYDTPTGDDSHAN